MKGSARQPKTVMDPPEEREPMMDPPGKHGTIRYALGDVGKPKDMALDADDNLLAVARLKPRDHCFVLRSGGRFTFAKVVSRSHGPGARMEVQVDSKGSIKTIPMALCAKYVRPVNSTVRRKPPSDKPHRRSSLSEPPAHTHPQKLKLRRQGLERRSSLQVDFLFTTPNSNTRNNGQQNPSLKKQLNLNSNNFQSRLNDVKLRPASHGKGSRRASFDSGLVAPSRRRPGNSGRCASLRASIETHIPEDTSISDSIDELSSDIELSSVDDLKSASESSSKSNADDENDWASPSSSDEELPRPQSLLTEKRKDFAKRVSLSGGFDDLGASEVSLLAAFRSIGTPV